MEPHGSLIKNSFGFQEALSKAPYICSLSRGSQGTLGLEPPPNSPLTPPSPPANPNPPLTRPPP